MLVQVMMWLGISIAVAGLAAFGAFLTFNAMISEGSRNTRFRTHFVGWVLGVGIFAAIFAVKLLT